MTGDAPRIGASADIRFTESVQSFAEFLAERGLNHVELRQGYLDVREEPEPTKLRRIASEHDVTYTLHAPHVDANLGNVNETLRTAAVVGVKESVDLAAAVDAEGVVVHGGSIRTRYPDHVNSHERVQAVQSLRECAAYAAERGVPLCLENQRDTDGKRRNTATPDRLAAFLDDIGADADALRITLDVGHANVQAVENCAFVERFGDRIHVVHLHDNDGEDDDHDPLPSYRDVVERVGAPYNVLEMKSLEDIERCVRGTATAADP